MDRLRHLVLRRLVHGAAATALLAPVAACTISEPAQAPTCADLVASGGPPTTISSQTVVLVDRSASMRTGTAASDAAGGWSGMLLDELVADFSEKDGRRISVGAFDGSASTVSWTVDANLAGAEGDGQTVDDDKKAARDCLHEPVRRALTEKSATAGTDVLGALSAASQRFSKGAGRKRLLIVTDGLANTGCGDLRQTAMGERDQGAETAKLCGQELPNLEGVEVSILGVGLSTQDGRFDSKELRWLTGFWADLCAAAGGRCTVDSQPPARGTDGIAVTVQTPTETDDPVRFPAPIRRTTGRTTVWELPASLLFDTASADLSGAARGEIGRVADEIKRLPVESVTVIGHTDSRGTDTYNEGLSTRRASAVDGVLNSLGIRTNKPEGRGERVLKCNPETTKDGKTLDRGKLACNRRVEIVVRTKGAA